jgi:hypothetical protein
MAGKLEASKSDLRHAEERLVAAVKARKELQAKLEEIGSARPVSAHVSEYPQQLSTCPPCACDHVSEGPVIGVAVPFSVPHESAVACCRSQCLYCALACRTLPPPPRPPLLPPLLCCSYHARHAADPGR